MPTGWPETVTRTVATVLAVFIATLISMIIGELVPKNFALSLPRQTAKVVIPFQVDLHDGVPPGGAPAQRHCQRHPAHDRRRAEGGAVGARTAEELASLVRRSASEGSLDRDTATLLARTLAFSAHTAQDVMTPRPRLAHVDRADTAQDVIDLARRTGFSRFPVVDDKVDDVVGIVHVKQAVAVPRDKRGEVPVGALQSDALRVPETMKLDSLLGELRSRGYQMAIVVDEYGGTAGVATLEDLVEELVGEVSDEHDRSKADVVRSRDWFTFPGLLRPDELLERTSISVPEDGPFETVGGWLMSELGHIPIVGDTVEIPGGVFRIERLDGRRIDRVRYTPHRVDPEGVVA